MDKIVSLRDYGRQKAARRGFKAWKAMLPGGGSLDENTVWQDLPDEFILVLCEDKQKGRLLIYHLIMGALNLGNGYGFESLPSRQLVPLMDVYFMLIDLAHFECMRRLGWIEDIPCEDEAIIDLLVETAEGNGPGFIRIPRLAKAHPAYDQDMESNDLDRQVLVRKYAKEAVRVFKARIHDKTSGRGI